jgi:PAS domain S-box-containing protein
MSQQMTGLDLRRLLDALPDAIIAVDGEGRIVYASSSVTRWLGWRADELAGKPLEATLLSGALPRRAGRHGDGAPVGPRRCVAQRKDQSHVELEHEVHPAPHGLEQVEALHLFRPPRRIRAIETRSSTDVAPVSPLDALSDGILLIEGDEARISWCNRATTSLLGLDRPPATLGEMLTLLPWERIDGRGALPLEDHPLSRAVAVSESCRDVVRLGQRGDGRESYFEIQAAPLLAGRPGVVASIRDVTVRHRAEMDLTDRANQLKALLDHLPVGVVYFDQRTICRAHNGPARRIFGKTREEISGATADQLLGRTPALYEAMLRCVQARTSFIETSVPWGDASSIRYLDWRFEPLGSPEASRPSGVLALIVDVTERTHGEQALQRAAVAAENASKRKTQFLSAVSHDLRTPVNALSLEAELLLKLLEEEPDASEELIELAGDIRQVVKNLIELLNDLLDLTRFDTGYVDDRPTTFAVEPWLEAALAPLESSAAAKGLDFTWRVDRQDRMVRGDRVKLSRVLVNLVSNAVKFTDSGRVDVTVRATPDGGLLMTVRDEGPGIPPEQIDGIFDEFTQLRNPERDRTKGTGLGLAICRRLVEGVRGRLTVESRVDEGSTFTAIYPPEHVSTFVASDKSQPPVEEPKRRTGQAPLLLVEDDQTSRNTLARLLAHAGYAVETAVDGLDAIEVLKRIRPQLILLDLLLPGMQGTDVLRLIRQSPEWKDIPVVLLTGDALSGRTADLMALNIDGILVKPVDLDQLLATVGRLQPARA